MQSAVMGGGGGGAQRQHEAFSRTPQRLITALTWAAVRCHVAVTGAVAIVAAAADAAVLVIGTRAWPVVWQPQLVVRLSHAEEARSASRKDTRLSIRTDPPHRQQSSLSSLGEGAPGRRGGLSV